MIVFTTKYDKYLLNLCITFLYKKWYNYNIVRGFDGFAVLRCTSNGGKMLKLNEKVMYGTTGVCVVQSIEDKKIGREIKRYYVLKPVSQTTSTVFLPANNETLLKKVRSVLSADEVRAMLKVLPSEPDVWVDNDAERKLRFGEIISSGDRKACLVLMRTLHNRQSELSTKGKRLHIADERALKEAQRLIHDEFSVALNMDLREVEEFVKSELKTI